MLPDLEQIAQDIAAWGEGWTWRAIGNRVHLTRLHRTDTDGETSMDIDITITIATEPNWSGAYVTTEIGSPTDTKARRLVATNVRNAPVRKALAYINDQLDKQETAA